MRLRTRPVALLALALGAPTFVLAEAPDPQSVERGRYLSAIAGCNDCHTPGYLLADGAVDEALWLTGDRFGWRGPWGTTYPPNLRLYIAPLTEDQWVTKAQTLRARPPMPWYTLNQMAESDLRDLYRFIHHLGPAGGPAPAYVPPGEEPGTPFALFPALTQTEPGGGELAARGPSLGARRDENDHGLQDEKQRQATPVTPGADAGPKAPNRM